MSEIFLKFLDVVKRYQVHPHKVFNYSIIVTQKLYVLIKQPTS